MFERTLPLVPESFRALHVRDERLAIAQDVLEARYATSESLARQITEVFATEPYDDAPSEKELRAVAARLIVHPDRVKACEVQWIVDRVVELTGISTRPAGAGGRPTRH